MLDRHTVVAAYDATDEAADGLALARLLAGVTDTEVLIVRVLEGYVDTATPDPATQAETREVVGATRRALIAAVPEAGESPQIVPVLDPDLAHGLHETASAHDADFLVLGSSHHSGIGRILLGGTAEMVVNDAPCPVAVAPPGFRESPRIDPGVIGCAYDGSAEARDALRRATDLARAAGLPLRVMSVGYRLDELLDEAAASVAEQSEGRVFVERLALGGSPADALIGETQSRVGLLVMGSRQRGPVRRALLGSVSTQVIRKARCPVLITPGRG